MGEGVHVEIPGDEVHKVFADPKEGEKKLHGGEAAKKPLKELAKEASKWKWLFGAVFLALSFVIWAILANQHSVSGEEKISGDPGVVAAAAGDKSVLGQARHQEVDDLTKVADEKDKQNPTYVQGLEGKLADAVQKARDDQPPKQEKTPPSDQDLAKVAKADANSIQVSPAANDPGARVNSAVSLDKVLEKAEKRREATSGFVRLDADKPADDGGYGNGQAGVGNLARVSADAPAAAAGKVILPGTHLFAIQSSDWNSWQPGQLMEATVMNSGLIGLKLIGRGVLSKDGVLTADYTQFTYYPPNNGPAKSGPIKAIGQGLRTDERGRRNLAQGSDQHYFQRYVAPALVKFAGNLPAAQVAANTQNTQLQSIGGIGVATAPTLKDSSGAKVAYALANSGISNVGDDMSARMAATPPESWVTKGQEIDVTILEALKL